MDFTQLSDDHSTVISHPTTNLIFQPCYQFPSTCFETGSSTVPYIMNACLNVLQALVTTVANSLVLSAIRKNTSLHLPSKLLLGSLILTDLGVGIAVQPMFASFLIAKVKSSSGIICPLYIWYCGNHADLCVFIDDGSNKFGPVHCFVLPPQVP